MLTTTGLVSASFASAQIPLPAEATEPTPPQDTYTPEYFSQFQPQTALDMVGRLPGFSLESGDGGRGFGQASLNILINGRRPSSKSQGPREILEQITAETVVRIEIVDGSTLDIPGLQGQVANVIVKAGELSGTWRYAARFRQRSQPQLLEGGISLTGRRGDLGFTAQVEMGQFILDEVGVENFSDADGTIFEERTERLTLSDQRPNASLNLAWTPSVGPLAGHVANLNLSGQLFNRDQSNRETFIARAPQGRTGSSFVTGGEDEYNYEIGADYAIPLGAGQFKMIGLYRYEDSDFPTRFTFAEDGETPFRQTVFRDDRESETILRSEYNITPATNHTLQFSGEYALNTLKSDTVFTRSGVDDAFDTVEVEENRFEGFLTHGWTISDAFNLQTSIGAEYSEIDVLSIDAEPQDFIRPKGTVAASYVLNPEWTLRGSVERRVGQLGFGNFISTINVTDVNATEGNDSIVPDQRWVLEAEVQRNIAKGLSGTLTGSVHFLEDQIENIRFENGTIGPGNLDGGRAVSLEADVTWVLDELVTPGLRVEFNGAWIESELDDPITGEKRPFSGDTNWFYDLEVRYDLPGTPWAFEGEIERSSPYPSYRVDEISQNRFIRPEVEFKIVHKDFLGIQWTVGMQNMLDFRFKRERQVFNDDRLGTIRREENFTRRRGRRLIIELTDTF
jgi:hypothetical protein